MATERIHKNLVFTNSSVLSGADSRRLAVSSQIRSYRGGVHIAVFTPFDNPGFQRERGAVHGGCSGELLKHYMLLHARACHRLRATPSPLPLDRFSALGGVSATKDD